MNCMMGQQVSIVPFAGISHQCESGARARVGYQSHLKILTCLCDKNILPCSFFTYLLFIVETKLALHINFILSILQGNVVCECAPLCLLWIHVHLQAGAPLPGTCKTFPSDWGPREWGAWRWSNSLTNFTSASTEIYCGNENAYTKPMYQLLEGRFFFFYIAILSLINCSCSVVNNMQNGSMMNNAETLNNGNSQI